MIGLINFIHLELAVKVHFVDAYLNVKFLFSRVPVSTDTMNGLEAIRKYQKVKKGKEKGSWTQPDLLKR